MRVPPASPPRREVRSRMTGNWWRTGCSRQARQQRNCAAASAARRLPRKQRSALLQYTLERMIELVPAACRGAIVLRDANTHALLLKAHVPAGSPAVSLTLASRAIAERQGFIWERGEDITLSQQESGADAGMYAP